MVSLFSHPCHWLVRQNQLESCLWRQVVLRMPVWEIRTNQTSHLLRQQSLSPCVNCPPGRLKLDHGISSDMLPRRGWRRFCWLWRDLGMRRSWQRLIMGWGRWGSRLGGVGKWVGHDLSGCYHHLDDPESRASTKAHVTAFHTCQDCFLCSASWSICCLFGFRRSPKGIHRSGNLAKATGMSSSTSGGWTTDGALKTVTIVVI